LPRNLLLSQCPPSPFFDPSTFLGKSIHIAFGIVSDEAKIVPQLGQLGILGRPGPRR
jgi:hypothetical protein